ncbi:hypothetical protein VTK73DRAFT_2202 [Phialemonium thermophilum]|uniref:MICOS complex subunit MIC60 n=1 Tax=Phialemonium thermophilum TaxID=223376 RepID=A0ABR3Y1E4_9PEZI
MLRAFVQSARALRNRPVATAADRQWLQAVVNPAKVGGERLFADERKPRSEALKPASIPTSETRTASSAQPPPPTAESAVASSTIPPENVPLTPPGPETSGLGATASATSPRPPTASAPPSTPRKKSFFRRLRNYVLTLAVLGALAFGGGVWYSRINDNFHDFFTEYVPFGEQAVLYFEEMDFRKRFPNVSQRISGRRRDVGDHVKVSAQSGASWRVADNGEPAGRQSSSVHKTTVAKETAATSQPSKEGQRPETAASSTSSSNSPPAVEPKAEAKPSPGPATVAAAPGVAREAPSAVPSSPAPETSTFKPPEVDEPSRFPPASPIDPLTVNGAMEPVVQDLVRMINDIVTVINADGAHERYGTTIAKAKDEINKVADKINAIKAAAEENSAKKSKSLVDAFDRAANDLVNRVERAMAAQETEWRREFETEMTKLKQSYDEKVKVVLDRERQLNEERLNNRLLEQAIEMQRQFTKDIKKLVEEERNGRLGKLEELSSAVGDLQKLMAGWGEVIDTNLKTQQLHVAIDAVRASLQDSQHPRPFIKELVALKEIAADDAVVDAAIASIPPSAYQRGVATPAELMDRFRRVAAEVRKASLLPEDAGVASHASSLVLSKLMFKKQGHADGDDVESILTRTQALLEEGDLDNAAREMNTLTGWAKTLSRDWLGEVRKVLEVQQALEVIQTEAKLQSLKLSE